MMQTVHFMTLGCPNNGVDSATAQQALQSFGLTPVADGALADVVVINTCALTQADQEAAIERIIAAGQWRTLGGCKQLIVAGCLSQGFAAQLQDALPEVDAFIGTGNLHTLPRLLGLAHVPPKRTLSAARTKLPPKRLKMASPMHVAINLAQGCSNPCTFCVVPALRGPMRPASVQTIERAARMAVQNGAKEINLYAHDLGAWETVGAPQDTLPHLIRTLDGVGRSADGPVWFRLHHAHPASVTPRFIEALANADFVLPYVCLPIQHISDALLLTMGRQAGETATRRLIATLRASVPHLVLRGTLLTGLPGETEADFQALVALVESQVFDHLHIAAYSPQENTPAAAMPQSVPEAVAENRCAQLRALNDDLQLARNEERMGEVVEVLVEGVSPQSDLLLQGRHRGQGPQGDGVTYITDGSARPGDFVHVRVDEVHAQDLAGAIVGVPTAPVPTNAYDPVALPHINVLGAQPL